MEEYCTRKGSWIMKPITSRAGPPRIVLLSHFLATALAPSPPGSSSMEIHATTAAAAWAALPPMSAMWKTKVLEDAGGDLLQFEGINRRGKAAAVFPFTHAAMPTCDNRDNRMIQARFSSTSNNFREPVGDPCSSLPW